MTAVSDRVVERQRKSKHLRTEPFKGPFKCQQCSAVNGKKKRGGGFHKIYVYVNGKTNKQQVRCIKHL
jgi:hypothetical protein